MPLTAGARLGPYEISAWLGSAGMGDVYRARDTRLGRSVAIKILADQLLATSTRRERLAREAWVVSALSHPSICTLHDVGEHDGVQFVVMEYLEGETLSRRLLRGALPIADVLRVGAEIADGLAHAHRYGIVHCDLKPANIMLTPTGVKLLDFGLARLESQEAEATGPPRVGTASATESLTDEGLIVGTVQYMAPEQLEGKRIDGRADIFALGAVLYEMATGRPAFEGTSKAGIIAAILEREVPPVSLARQTATGEDVASPLLDRIVARCVAKNLDARWQTAGDLAHALKWPEANPPYTDGPRRAVRGRWRVSHPAWIAGSFLTLASFVAAALMLNRERPQKDERPERWLVTAPEGSSFDPSGGSLAVSPDGAYLAFIAASASGDNALWVRPFDSVVPRKLTSGASQPFWSFDSRSIAFDGGGELKKVDLASGLVEPIAETFAQSGSWNRDGLLLLGLPFGEKRHNHSRHGLYSIAASGGRLMPATTLDAELKEFNHTLPSFLPDGRHYLFVSRSTDRELDGMLYAGSLDSPERVRLFQSRKAIYASGYLLFVRDRTLLAQAFDPTTLRLEGEPALVADDLDWRSGAAFSISQTGVLAYRTDRPTELVWFDRRGRSLGSIGSPGHYANPSLSPDEKRLAVGRQDSLTGQSDVWVIDLKGHQQSKLTFGEPAKGMPLWSQDGSQIVYRSGRTLVMKASNGMGSETQLADRLTNFDNPLDWSSDGRMLLYTSFDSTSTTDLWMLPFGGDKQRIPVQRSGSRWGVQGQISPDGRWLAYASNERGRYDVYVRSFPSGEGRWLVTPGGGSEPSWRADGKELYYLSADGSLMAVSVTTEPTFEMATATRLFQTNLSTLVNTSFTRNQYVVSADGRRFLLNQPTGAPASIVVVVDWPAGLRNRQ